MVVCSAMKTLQLTTASFLLAGGLLAQTSGQATTNPPAQKEGTVEALKTRIRRMEARLEDWAELGRYAKANAELGAPKKGEKRVVFYGDSITDVWRLDEYFPNHLEYINRGISGQTTPQMLIRFMPDVLDLKPAAVVILAGTNDIAGNTGPMTVEQIEENYAAMATLARANSVKVYFCSVLPVHGYTERSKIFFPSRDPKKILALNAWLKSNAKKYDYIYVDYFSEMVDESGYLQKDLAEDGLHPNAKSYAVMASVLNAALKSTAGKKK